MRTIDAAKLEALGTRIFTALGAPEADARLVATLLVRANLRGHDSHGAIRIPQYSQKPPAKRLEFRCPDPSCNPYLAFSAMLMAGLDGIQDRTEPIAPVDKDIYDLEPTELRGLPSVPGSLEAALEALEGDHKFLLGGDVFSQDLIETWIDYKRAREVDAIRLRPHPYEFALYFDL